MELTLKQRFSLFYGIGSFLSIALLLGCIIERSMIDVFICEKPLDAYMWISFIFYVAIMIVFILKFLVQEYEDLESKFYGSLITIIFAFTIYLISVSGLLIGIETCNKEFYRLFIAQTIIGLLINGIISFVVLVQFINFIRTEEIQDEIF